MKNFKIFTVAALAATTLFAACQKDGGDAVKDGEPAFAGISILLKSEGAATRAPQAGSAKESAIATVDVYIIDNATSVMHTKSLTIGDFEAESGGFRRVTDAIPTTTGNKTIYVVANAPTAAGSLKSKLTSVADIKSNVLPLDETHFYTGNSYDGTADKLTSVVMTGSGTQNITTAQDQAAALANPVKIALTRNVAKVAVKLPATALTVKNGALSGNLQFGLAAKAKSSFLMTQSSGNTALYTLPGAPIAANYWTDNFSGRTGLSYVDVNANSTLATAANAWFALEHTPQTFLDGNTTKIVIKGIYVPNAMVQSYTSGTNPQPTSYSTGPAVDYYVNKATQHAWNTAAYGAAIASNDYVAADFSEKYIGGMNYYQVNIKAGQTGAKGVIRNNYYELTIGAINGFGDPVEDGGSEPDTAVPDDANIAFELKVSDWEFHAWVEDLQ